jgi:metal-sulfur cluster biosynthetic enzyme
MEISEFALMAAMRDVIDPELGVNVVDLGLVYSAQCRDDVVKIAMTMTTPACPLHSYLKEAAQTAIRERFPEVRAVEVEIVWEPKWSPAMMSQSARHQLGWN